MCNQKKVLRDARKKLGLTQRQVADTAHIAVRHYQLFEGGKRRLSSASFHLARNVLMVLQLDLYAFASDNQKQ